MTKSLSFLAGLLLPLIVLAGTNTVTYEELYGVKVANFSWSNGSATGTNDESCVCTSKPIAGVVGRMSFISCMASNATFTATLKDNDGADLLTGWGSVPTQMTSSAYTFCPGYPQGDNSTPYGTTNIHPWTICSPLVLTVSGLRKLNVLRTGSLKLYYRE